MNRLQKFAENIQSFGRLTNGVAAITLASFLPSCTKTATPGGGDVTPKNPVSKIDTAYNNTLYFNQDLSQPLKTTSVGNARKGDKLYSFPEDFKVPGIEVSQISNGGFVEISNASEADLVMKRTDDGKNDNNAKLEFTSKDPSNPMTITITPKDKFFNLVLDDKGQTAVFTRDDGSKYVKAYNKYVINAKTALVESIDVRPTLGFDTNVAKLYSNIEDYQKDANGNKMSKYTVFIR